MYTFECVTDNGEVYLIEDIGEAEAEEQCERLYACFVLMTYRFFGGTS